MTIRANAIRTIVAKSKVFRVTLIYKIVFELLSKSYLIDVKLQPNVDDLDDVVFGGLNVASASALKIVVELLPKKTLTLPS